MPGNALQITMSNDTSVSFPTGTIITTPQGIPITISNDVDVDIPSGTSVSLPGGDTVTLMMPGRPPVNIDTITGLATATPVPGGPLPVNIDALGQMGVSVSIPSNSTIEVPGRGSFHLNGAGLLGLVQGPTLGPLNLTVQNGQEFRPGDELSIEGPGLVDIREVTFVGVEPTSPGGPRPEFGATWREPRQNIGGGIYRIYVGIPRGLPILVMIRVTTSTGTATSPNSIIVLPEAPTITGMEELFIPNQPRSSAIRTIRIRGTNFGINTLVDVHLGHQQALVVRGNNTEITATVPSGTPAGRVIVSAQGGITASAVDFQLRQEQVVN